MTRNAESVAHWRDTMDDPCTCSPGDGSDECERYHECLSAWLRVCHAARIDGQVTSNEGGASVGS